MPYRMTKYRKKRPRRRSRRGGSFFKKLWGSVKRFGSKANRFLKKTKAISSIAPLLGPYGSALGAVAKHSGYGRKRRMVRGRRRGRGINTAGGGIRLAGGFKKKYSRGMSY